MSDPSEKFPETLRQLPRHLQFTERLVEELRGDARFLALLLGGSGGSNTMGEFSDLDFVVVAEADRYAEVMDDRMELARRPGNLLAAFTGEHVGEPRLIICLYGPPLLHVDLKFVVPADLIERVEEPMVLWERDRAASTVLADSAAEYPQPDPQWIEDRFWVVVHYAASRAERGEILEAVSAIGFIAAHFLGPLALRQSGAQPNGVRRLEDAAPEWAARIAELLPEPTLASCLEALSRAVRVYQDLRRGEDNFTLRSEAEQAVVAYLREARAEADAAESAKGWAGKHSDRLHRRRGPRP